MYYIKIEARTASPGSFPGVGAGEAVAACCGEPGGGPCLERQLDADPGSFGIDAGVEHQVLDVDVDGVEDIQ